MNIIFEGATRYLTDEEETFVLLKYGDRIDEITARFHYWSTVNERRTYGYSRSPRVVPVIDKMFKNALKKAFNDKELNLRLTGFQQSETWFKENDE